MLAKMEENEQRKEGGKKRKHPKGEERDRKRRGDCDGGGDGDARKRLDPLSVGYFRRVGERLTEGFAENEEKVMFVENVLTEVKGKAAVVAMDVTGSITLQRLLPLATSRQVGEVLAELGGESGSEFKTVSCDKCGGHVVESVLRQMPRCTAELGPPQKDQTSTTEEEDEGGCGMLEAQVLSVLGGCLGPARTETRPGAKERNFVVQLTDFEVPTSFWWELKSLSSSLMNSVKLSVTDAVASAVFQTLLTVCHRKRPILCKQLLKGIVGYLTSLSSAPGVSPLLVFMKDHASSRLLETVIQLSHKALLRDLYKNHFKGQLVTLAIHPIANFPIQRFTAASTKYKMFLKVFDELMEGMEAVLAAGHMGVIVQLTESCVEREEKQAQMMRCLLTAFHCTEPASRQTSCLPLFMSLLTYEVYYHSETAGGEIDTERPLSSICYHGSLLVQTLAKFKDRSLLLGSLRSLTPADLLILGTNQCGSHVLQVLITTSSDKGRGKILRRLEGQFVQMACSRLGSRVLEAVWNSSSVSQRQSIAQELVPSETRLRSDQFARHVWAKFSLTSFVRRHKQWQEGQTGESKKRKLFSDILD
ncbi:nucleolar protein 9 isoform X3 [Hypomesus transpacificus]|uniref:nucleolar protein 9 isoform X3 n=1 Tax=Hypomesus transpacificus TaxID=137520 RepID=UPI001F0821FD|nr:nucleolar protein 9 isoform X3 [Hypomesus transpacificus]